MEIFEKHSSYWNWYFVNYYYITECPNINIRSELTLPAYIYIQQILKFSNSIPFYISDIMIWLSLYICWSSMRNYAEMMHMSRRNRLYFTPCHKISKPNALTLINRKVDGRNSISIPSTRKKYFIFSVWCVRFIGLFNSLGVFNCGLMHQ